MATRTDDTMETAAPFAEVAGEIREAGGEALDLCYQCGLCDVVCPWNRLRTFSMRKVIREAAFGLSGIEGEEIWRCTTCGTCPRRCPRGVEQVELSVALRRVASRYDVFHPSARPARTVRSSLLTEGNPLEGARAKRADWAAGLPVKPYEEGMEALWFVGCYYSYDPRLKKVAAATAAIFDRAGMGVGILGSAESCCGESIRKTGAEELFKKLARENIKAFVDRGVKKVIVSSPHCYHTFTNEYPEFMVRFEVVHATQAIAALVRDGRLPLSGKAFARRVTYHDPCYLGRHNGIFDEPRAVLGSVPGLELVEMEGSRMESLCCGGGGGRIWMDTPKNERLSNLRLEQARATGAQVLATSCPYCIANFEDSRLGMEGEGVPEVKDVVEIVREVV